MPVSGGTEWGQPETDIVDETPRGPPRGGGRGGRGGWIPNGARAPGFPTALEVLGCPTAGRYPMTRTTSTDRAQ
eukprot:14138707-Alexandrium_andersonii.AAC.1